MFEINRNNDSFILNFLVGPKFRIWRHLAIILIFVILSLNQTMICYRELIPSIENEILYVLLFFTLLSYIVIAYINLLILIPRYLLKRKYVAYLTSICVLIMTTMLSHDAMEYMMYRHLGLDYYYFLTFISNIPALFVNLICIGGLSIPIYIRNWMLYKYKVNQLEKSKLFSEVEQLKEQVNPVFLFDILNRTGTLAKDYPEKASDMLMKLSLLLRYQLYDCNRDKVLLASEITFLTNYLDLEKLYASNFDFSINARGDIHKTFISPLLMLTFIQNSVKSFEQNGRTGYIKANITADKNEILLTCIVENSRNIVLSDSAYQHVKQRLDFLYNNNYMLTVSNNEAKKEAVINLKLKNCG